MEKNYAADETLEMAGVGETRINIEEPVNEVIPTTERKKKKLLLADTYAAKKTVAQGMMDIALITANANQLRYLIEYSKNSPTFEINVALIIISLVLQVAVGVSLIFKGRYDLNGEAKLHHANRLNNYVVVGIFIVTVINVFVAAFSISVSHPTIDALQLLPSIMGPRQVAITPQEAEAASTLETP